MSNLSVLVHVACDATKLKQKLFMTALRHALTAMKVWLLYFPAGSLYSPRFVPQTGPTIPETIDVLGLERTVLRLKHALRVNGPTTA